jgi:hypothetical protein
MATTQEMAELDLAIEIDDAALEALLGDEAAVGRLIEEEADTSLLPSALSVIALTVVVKC